MSVSDLEIHFPNLRHTRYEITSPVDARYNCIAWAAGAANRYWWPRDRPRYYWPENFHDESLETFVRMFRSIGYEVCECSELEPSFEKVAIYVKDSAVTHTARQLTTGEWTSKCGDLEDITHTLEGLEYSDYGRVEVILKRGRDQPDQG